MDPLYYKIIGAALVLLVLILDRTLVELRLRRMEHKAIPFWQGLQKIVARHKMTHPHKGAERADQLLKRLVDNPNRPISDEDRAELLARARAVAAGEDPFITDESEKAWAAVFPLIMLEVQKEAQSPSEIVDVQLLGIKK